MTKDPERYIPINKGNYSMDTPEREHLFEKNRGSHWATGYQQYRNDWSELPKKLEVRDYPLLVDIELSSICNLKCPMCYTISDEFKSQVNIKLMDESLFRKIVDEIAGNVPAIRLSFRGESFLHPQIVEFIHYAKQSGIKEVSTLTNGAKLTLPFFEKLCDAGIDWITISVDGVGKVYESIRKPLKFEKLYGMIKDISEYKKRNSLLKPVIKVQGIWPAIKQDIEEYYRLFSPITDLVAFNPLIDYLFKDSDIEYLDNFSCPQQYQRLVVGADGTVMKCSNDEENKEPVGDANIQTIYDIWHGPELTRIRKLMLEKNGFMSSDVCKRCYLPRKTENELAAVDGREFYVKNYTLRSQEVGS